MRFMMKNACPKCKGSGLSFLLFDCKKCGGSCFSYGIGPEIPHYHDIATLKKKKRPQSEQ